MQSVDRELCEAEELKDFIIRNRLLYVESNRTVDLDARFGVVWSANAREQIGEYLKRIKQHVRDEMRQVPEEDSGVRRGDPGSPA